MFEELMAYEEETSWTDLPEPQEEPAAPIPHLEVSAIKVEVMKGIDKKANPYHLLLQASKAISLLTNDVQFFEQVSRQLAQRIRSAEREKDKLENCTSELKTYKKRMLTIIAAQEEVLAGIRAGDSTEVLLLKAVKGLNAHSFLEDMHFKEQIKELLNAATMDTPPTA